MRDTALLRRLPMFSDLNDNWAALFYDAIHDVRTTKPKRDIISEGNRPEELHLIVSGWAARCKTLPNGSRQITAFLIPGDFCDLQGKILGRMDHSVVALTNCEIAWIESDRFDRLTMEHPDLTRALWLRTLLDAAILRQWIVNNGRRSARQRIAHLLCELHARMDMARLVHNNRLHLPVTQTELGDATSLTAIHVNRTLQRLRGEGLITLSGRVLTINNITELQQVADFDGGYLHKDVRIW